MESKDRHPHAPDVVLDGGTLDCGSGLLLLIREKLDPLPLGDLLEIRSLEGSTEEDLPAWCRMTGNALVSFVRDGAVRSFLVSKGAFVEKARKPSAAPPSARAAPSVAAASAFAFPIEKPVFASELPTPVEKPIPRPLATMGVGSWPRTPELMAALHARLESRIDEKAFEAAADQAVDAAVAAQERAGVDVVSDGEQRRDNYASFVGAKLQNCRLVPLNDLLPLVDDPESLARDFASLDVPADRVRHPVAFGPIGRSRPLAVDELVYLEKVATRATKVALPGPYLLVRTMWLECLTDRAYRTRESLAADVVRVLREELFFLLSEGATLVQFDEPVLTEVVHGRTSGGRSFMCGALSEKGETKEELRFAAELLNAVVRGAPRDRVLVHVCRGNWTPDESAALAGDYRPLVETFASFEVGALLLETCTPRAGDVDLLRGLHPKQRLGLGAVNQKLSTVESVEETARRVDQAAKVVGYDRLWLASDCGFATFADNPVASAEIAERKLRVLCGARDLVSGRAKA
jgi:5-methyltetrahydropteroyltriglutamate--homocysteine methyltransferase